MVRLIKKQVGSNATDLFCTHIDEMGKYPIVQLYMFFHITYGCV